ncbi:uncharacterized protein LOC135809138 [Sycon ciliatum]|uniref:uncharacterized protein LOC135809138 n=1 Tax=Sycon ciliatum TaxID=27933 RepID=UPI0031F71F11
MFIAAKIPLADSMRYEKSLRESNLQGAVLTSRGASGARAYYLAQFAGMPDVHRKLVDALCEDPSACYPCGTRGSCFKNLQPDSEPSQFQRLYMCQCPDGFKSLECVGNLCRGNSTHKQPCLNGGACQRLTIAPYYSCACPRPFRGQRCETGDFEYDPCHNKPCKNGGTCSPDEADRSKANCACVLGFSGVHCRTMWLQPTVWYKLVRGMERNRDSSVKVLHTVKHGIALLKGYTSAAEENRQLHAEVSNLSAQAHLLSERVQEASRAASLHTKARVDMLEQMKIISKDLAKMKSSGEAARYQLHHGNVTWNEAASKCKHLGGKLAAIHNEQHYQDLLALRGIGRMKGAWIGARSNKDASGNPSHYTWIDGEQVLASNWAQGQPHHHVLGRRCVFVSFIKISPSGAPCAWLTDKCSSLSSLVGGFICEHV